MTIRNSKLGLLAAAAGLVGGAVLTTGSASASIADPHTRSVTLRYDPRELNSVKGAERLLARVGSAATKVCDDGGTAVDRFYSRDFRTCRLDAIAQAVTEINRPTVTAAYDRHFAERGNDKRLRAALEPHPLISIRMVAVGWGEEAPETSTTDAL